MVIKIVRLRASRYALGVYLKPNASLLDAA